MFVFVNEVLYQMGYERLFVLEEILNDYFQDEKNLEKELQDNLTRLEEINIFIQALEESEETDIKFFSPRSVQNVHFDKIQKLKKERDEIEKDNHSHYKKIEQCKNRIESIKLLWKDNKESTITDIKNQDKFRHLKILDVQEKERIRIARELHDSSLQNLTHLIHLIELSSMFIEQDPIRAKLELASCSQNLKQIISEIRDTIFNLRPMSFDDLGFKQCLEDYVDNIRQKYKECFIQYEVDDIQLDLSDDRMKEKYNLFFVTSYRVIQEAVTNSLKHSGADKLELYIREKEDNYFIQIIDNGKGFSVEKVTENSDKHFGISIMSERVFLLNGTIKITSEIDEGTKVEIEIPKP